MKTLLILSCALLGSFTVQSLV